MKQLLTINTKMTKYLPKISDVSATTCLFQTERSPLGVATVVAAESSKSS